MWVVALKSKQICYVVPSFAKSAAIHVFVITSLIIINKTGRDH